MRQNDCGFDATNGDFEMPHEKRLLSFLIDEDILRRVEDFRFENRFPTRAGAIAWLLQAALDKKLAPKREQSKN